MNPGYTLLVQWCQVADQRERAFRALDAQRAPSETPLVVPG